MKQISIVWIGLLFLSGIHPLNGQGCSDAGFCTMNSFKAHGDEGAESLANQIKLGAFYGLADYSISVYGSYLEYNRQFNSTWSIDAKLTSLGQSGNGISTFGVSDLFLNANYKTQKNFTFTAGAKLPLMQANASYNNRPLPMDYQASLGTFDLILGLGYSLKKFQFVAALQYPLTQNNNQFIASEYPLDSELSKIQSTNQFQRSGDILFRASYPFTLSKKLNLTLSLLPIYHLGIDKYTNALNEVMEIDGSDGLTLNGNLYLDYSINAKNSLQLNMGTPFIVREARPDGLTRSVIANLEYHIKF